MGLGFTRFEGRSAESGASSSSVRRFVNGSHQREASTEAVLAIGGTLGELNP